MIKLCQEKLYFILLKPICSFDNQFNYHSADHLQPFAWLTMLSRPAAPFGSMVSGGLVLFRRFLVPGCCCCACCRPHAGLTLVDALFAVRCSHLSEFSSSLPRPPFSTVFTGRFYSLYVRPLVRTSVFLPCSLTGTLVLGDLTHLLVVNPYYLCSSSDVCRPCFTWVACWSCSVGTRTSHV